MKKLFFMGGLVLFSGLATAQNSDKAEALLDEVYNKVKGYDNIQVDFKYSLDNAEANTHQDTRGDVTLEGNKYLLNYLGAKQLFDGKKVYTIVPENEEVTIEDKSQDENSFSPSEMFTFYKKGYDYAWDILQKVNGRDIQYIKLTPKDSGSDVKSILLGIDKETKHIYKLIETGANGTKTTITVNSFKTDQPLSKTLFNFDEEKYKKDGYYIIRN